MREVYIVDAVRTPVGRMGGTLKNTQAHEMGGLVCKALMERTGLAPELVEEVVIAQVKQNAVASNIARVCALMAGFREEIPAYTLMMQCGSSLQSVNCAANDIRCGDVDVAVAGGVEAMSATHFELWNARYGYGTGNNVLVDPIVGQAGPAPGDLRRVRNGRYRRERGRAVPHLAGGYGRVCLPQPAQGRRGGGRRRVQG